MRRRSSHTAIELLGQGPAARLLARARSLASLQDRVRQLLPEPLGAHCTVLNLRRGTLSLSADSPAWAARLRFLAPQLLRQLGTDRIRELRVRVHPQVESGARRPPARRARLSAGAGELVARTAEGIDHPALRTALRRLAAHRRRS
ncbi:MAG TPA: DUF721 domain-containing protein [Gammaproteobacteria bacterium]|nr:DUF721 domain-containing protein [Gammaproteobacteria bacterium]